MKAKQTKKNATAKKTKKTKKTTSTRYVACIELSNGEKLAIGNIGPKKLKEYANLDEMFFDSKNDAERIAGNFAKSYEKIYGVKPKPFTVTRSNIPESISSVKVHRTDERNPLRQRKNGQARSPRRRRRFGSLRESLRR